MLQLIKNLLANKPILSILSIVSSAVLLLFPGSATPDNVPAIPFLDKLFHIALFGACAFSLYFDYIVKKRKQPLLPSLLFAYILLFAGGIIEVLQELFLNRSGSTNDFIADYVGMVLGFLGAIVFANFLYQWARS